MNTKPIAVITGAASGLGLDLTKLLADQYGLILVDRDEQGLQAISAQFPNALLCVCDLADSAQRQALIAKIKAHTREVKLLINNAGITHRSLVDSTTESVFEKVMAIDYMAPVSLATGLLPQLMQGRGKVVNVGSMAGWMPVLGRAGYCAAKSALHQFFETFRAEMADQPVSVLMVYPSFLDTPIENNALDGAGGKASHKRTMAGKMRSSQWMAQRIVDAINSGTERLFGDGFTRFSSLLYAHWPSLYLKLMRRKLSAEMARQT